LKKVLDFPKEVSYYRYMNKKPTPLELRMGTKRANEWKAARIEETRERAEQIQNGKREGDGAIFARFFAEEGK
jgi:hypothetical protein